MRAIFWKEIRENLKWAAIGFIAFSLALALAWSGVADTENYQDFLSILSSSILMVTTLCGCGFGAALGFLQIIPEQRRDRWAFLVHRPVEWTTIFWGKVSAGLTLYFTATLVPWAFLCYWASVPGHIGAPFDWRMGLGGLADILAGTAFYFAGMITSLRQARWFGSKAFALAGALWVLSASDDAVHFLGACGWIAMMVVALAISARGNFLKGGVYTSQPALARVSLVAVFVLGLSMLIAWFFDFSQSMTYGGYQYGDQVEYRISKEGEPVKLFASGGRLTKVEDIDGNDLNISRELLASYTNNLPTMAGMVFHLQDDRMTGFYRSVIKYVSQSEQLQGTRWYYLRASRKLESYDHDSRKLTGYLVPDGYHSASDGVPSSTFPEAFENTDGFGYFTNIVAFGTRLYLIDYINLNVRQLAEMEKESDFRGSAYLSPERRTGVPVDKTFVAAGLKDGITFYKCSDGSAQTHVPYYAPYAEDFRAWQAITVSMTPDGLHFFVWYQPSWNKQADAGYILPSILFRYSMDGTEEKKWELPQLVRFSGRSPWTEHLWAIGKSLGVQLYTVGDALVEKQFGTGWAQDYDFGKGWKNREADWLVSALTGVVCAFVAIMRGRSYLLPTGQIAGWGLFVFFGGIAGLLVFLAAKEWPARATCSSCTKKRMVPLDICEHCGAPWDKPKHDGTEIFA